MQSFLLISIPAIAIGAVVIGLQRLHIHDTLKRNLKERSQDNFLIFSEYFRNRGIHKVVLTIVYNTLSKSTMAKEMPVRPNDDLRNVWGFDDDLNDLVFELKKQLGIADKLNGEEIIGKLKTVEDLVIHLSEKISG